MVQTPLPPPVPKKDPEQDRWLELLWRRVSAAGQILWSQLNFGGSNLADLETRHYNDLQFKPPIPVSLMEGGEEPEVIPGPPGRQGERGLQGAPGFALDGEDSDGLLFSPSEGIKATDLYRSLKIENGVVDKSQFTMSFTNATRTFTVTPTGAGFEIYSYGNYIYKTSAVSVVIPDVEGQHLFYFDASGNFTTTQTFDITFITQKGWVGLVYWDATNKEHIILSDERHGTTMDSQTHAYLHNTRHTVYQTGLELSGITADGSGDLAAHAEMQVSGGTIWDEDLQLTIVDGAPQVLSPVAQIPLYYRTGASGLWRRIAATDYPVSHGAPGPGTRANYNQLTGGVWQLTEVANLNFVNMHYFATNDTGSNKIIGIIGQTEWGTVTAAQDGALTEIFDLVTTGLPSLEWVPIATVIFQTSNGYLNTPKSRIRSTDSGGTHIDWRLVPGEPPVASGGGGSGSAIWGTITGTLSTQTDLQAALDAKVSRSQLPMMVEDQNPSDPTPPILIGPSSGGSGSTAWIQAFAAAHG